MAGEINITESWWLAEKTCFERLNSYLNTTEGTDSFMGYLPGSRWNVWALYSGGSANPQDITLTWGETGCFGTRMLNARCECAYQTRKDAQVWAMNIVNVLDQTNNMHEQGNVMWLRLADDPSDPELVPWGGDGDRLAWQIVIPMQLIFATKTTY
jgi:hypothetical protein